MNRRCLSVLGALSLAGVTLMGCGAPDTPPTPEPRQAGYSEAQIALGRKLVAFGGCNDCHTPWAFDPEIGAPVPDMSRALSGHPEGGPDPGGTLGEMDMAVIGPTFTSFRMPFGVVYSANLTPDEATGIGTWTEQMFVDVFRRAKHLGGEGRPILPPMPWTMTATLSDEEIVAMYAYLTSIPPIHNEVPVAQPPEEVQAAIDLSNQKLLRRIASGG